MEEQIITAMQPALPGSFAGLMAGLMAIALIVFFLLLLFLLAIYIYNSWAWYTIAKKLKCKHAFLAWIPIANYFLLPILVKKHWTYGFFILLPIANLVFAIIWCWEIYKKRGYSGELNLVKIGLVIPPLIPLALIADMIILGIVAWEKK